MDCEAQWKERGELLIPVHFPDVDVSVRGVRISLFYKTVRRG